MLLNEKPAMHLVEQALAAAPKEVDVILLVGLSVRLREPRRESEEELATELADCGMVNMASHFLPQRRYRGDGRWAWIMWREGWQVAIHGYPQLYQCGTE